MINLRGRGRGHLEIEIGFLIKGLPLRKVLIDIEKKTYHNLRHYYRAFLAHLKFLYLPAVRNPNSAPL